jgi:hypothetical protein
MHGVPKSGEVYYDNTGRRGSNDSVEGDYDVASAGMYYDNPAVDTRKVNLCNRNDIDSVNS